MKMGLKDVLSGDYSGDGGDEYGDDHLKDMLAEELGELLGLKGDKAKQVADVICRLAKLEVTESEPSEMAAGRPALSIILGK